MAICKSFDVTSSEAHLGRIQLRGFNSASLSSILASLAITQVGKRICTNLPWQRCIVMQVRGCSETRLM